MMTRILVALAAACVAVSAATAAPAVVPGKDGRIVYDAFDTDTGGTNIFSIGANGGTATELTTTADENTDPAISPNGKQIVFVSDRGNAGNFIWIMNADGSSSKKLGGGGSAQGTPTWSSDGKQIAFSRCVAQADGGGQCTSAQLAIVGTNGKGLKVLTKPLADAAIDSLPTWSPDGATIVFQRVESFGNATLWSVGVNGKGLKRLLDDESQLFHSPSFSPSGKQIVYATDTDGSQALYLMNARGDGVKKLLDEFTNDPGASSGSGGEGDPQGTESPSFSPSGKWIVFVAGGNLWKVDLAGKNVTQLTQDGGDHPDWGHA